MRLYKIILFIIVIFSCNCIYGEENPFFFHLGTGLIYEGPNQEEIIVLPQEPSPRAPEGAMVVLQKQTNYKYSYVSFNKETDTDNLVKFKFAQSGCPSSVFNLLTLPEINGEFTNEKKYLFLYSLYSYKKVQCDCGEGECIIVKKLDGLSKTIWAKGIGLIYYKYKDTEIKLKKKFTITKTFTDKKLSNCNLEKKETDKFVFWGPVEIINSLTYNFGVNLSESFNYNFEGESLTCSIEDLISEDNSNSSSIDCSADYQSGYNKGYEEGKNSCSGTSQENPFLPPTTSSQCATFDFVANVFSVPCFETGKSIYSLDFKLINTKPVQLELTNVKKK